MTDRRSRDVALELFSRADLVSRFRSRGRCCACGREQRPGRGCVCRRDDRGFAAGRVVSQNGWEELADCTAAWSGHRRGCVCPDCVDHRQSGHTTDCGCSECRP